MKPVRSKTLKGRSNAKSEGQIRIIGGQWRGRKLPVSNVEGLRPTTDRVRETLFNWLMNTLRDARVLDCFSGSGALSLEALSRYSRHATLLELDKTAVRNLIQNLKTLGHRDAQVIQGDSLQFLSKPCQQEFDITFIDPPFRQGLLQPCIDQLDKHGYIADGGWIYIETEAELTSFTTPASWHLHREKTAGQVSFRLYHKLTASID